MIMKNESDSEEKAATIGKEISAFIANRINKGVQICCRPTAFEISIKEIDFFDRGNQGSPIIFLLFRQGMIATSTCLFR